MDPETPAHYKVKADLIACIAGHRDARLVTDVGASLCSGWGTLVGFEYLSDENVIELYFD